MISVSEYKSDTCLKDVVTVHIYIKAFPHLWWKGQSVSLCFMYTFLPVYWSIDSADVCTFFALVKLYNIYIDSPDGQTNYFLDLISHAGKFSFLFLLQIFEFVSII